MYFTENERGNAAGPAKTPASYGWSFPKNSLQTKHALGIQSTTRMFLAEIQRPDELMQRDTQSLQEHWDNTWGAQGDPHAGLDLAVPPAVPTALWKLLECRRPTRTPLTPPPRLAESIPQPLPTAHIISFKHNLMHDTSPGHCTSF